MSSWVERNLAVVESHIRDEATDVDAVMALYTDDILFEVPSRNLRLVGREQIRANYLSMFASMAEIEIIPHDRFATESRVVDDMTVRFLLVGDGFVNAPVKPGSRVELRLIHHFEMKGGRIAREQVFEIWCGGGDRQD